MGGDQETRIQSVLAQLRERPPMSEEEFRYRLEPLRAAHELAISILLDALGKGDTAHDLAAAALHEIAVATDTERLVAAFRDVGRPEAARAEIVQVLAGIAGERLDDLLDADELAHLSALSLHTLLERLRDRSGLNQVIELYRQSSADERRALLVAIETATTRPSAILRLGTALDPLFAEEPERGIRAEMIHRLAVRPEPASARALGRWVTFCHGEERRRIQEAVRRLSRQGIRPGAQDGALAAWISGADGTGCYNVGISFPAALGLRDELLACISVETGLRAVSLISTVGSEAVAEIRATLEESQGIPVATLDPPSAFWHVREARRRTIELGRPLPADYEIAAPYLDRLIPLPAMERNPAIAAPESATSLTTLLDLRAYGSWVFPTSEISDDVVTVLATALVEIEPESRGHPDSGAARFRSLATRAIANLDGPVAQSRLAAMLRHQSEIHRLRSEKSAATRSLAAAQQIEANGLTRSPFALRMMERSLRALRAPSSRTPRPEVREALKRKIEEAGRPRRRDVLTLHLAEALLRQTEDINERISPSQRLTLDQIERLALAAAAISAKEFTRDSMEQTRLPGLEAPQVATRNQVRRRLRAAATRLGLERAFYSLLERETGFTGVRAERMAVAMATVAQWFADEICLRRCRRDCLTEPEADGRELFYAPDHPAGLDTGPPAASSLAPPALAPWRHLSRRLEDLLGEASSLLESLASLGFVAHGAERVAWRRIEEVVTRLRFLRQEAARSSDDPASLYCRIEEAEAFDVEFATLARPLVSASLRRLSPRPEQFSTFEAYPAARSAWRRFERLIRSHGLFDVEIRSFHAALDRLESTAPLLCLLRAVARPRSAARSRILAQCLADLSHHTPRTRLGSRTPFQHATADEAF